MTKRLREAAKQVHVRLSDRTQTALDTLHEDVEALKAMIADLTASQETLLESLNGEVVAFVAELSDPNGDGIEAFTHEDKPQSMRQTGGLPDVMQFTEMDTRLAEDERVRGTPFTRAPRYVQVRWLTEVMADGGWYGAAAIARTYATDEKHYRYMRGAVTGRLKEMHEEGLVERRDSTVRGSMFQYRLLPTS